MSKNPFMEWDWTDVNKLWGQRFSFAVGQAMQNQANANRASSPGASAFSISVNAGNTLTHGNLEAHITNRQKHAVIAEFGSGIYNDGTGNKSPIKSKTGAKLIIPVSKKYRNKYGSEVFDEAKKNAKKYPGIFRRMQARMPGVIGFIFRNSIKGMRPIRMVRNAIPAVEQKFTENLTDAINYLFNRAYQRSLTGEDVIARAINKTAAFWLREIVKNSPVLTSNLKTGWTISKLAK